MLRRLKRPVINACNQAGEFRMKEKTRQNGIAVDEQSLLFITSNNTDPVSYEPDDNLSEKIPDQYNMMVQWWWV